MERKNIICIVCPKGCEIQALKEDDGKISVTGNSCIRGANFAEAEMIMPTRSLTTTIPTVFKEMPYLPVRTKFEIPKEDIWRVIAILRKFKLETPVKCGDVVIPNIAMTGCDIIATSDI
ncbi:DUF1667 domain-containing protein [Eubacteriales bacterium KG127]